MSSVSIHDRVLAFQTPTTDSPAQIGIFCSLVVDYIDYLQAQLLRPDDESQVALELRTAEHFVSLISTATWRVTQSVTPHFQYPLNPDDKPWLLKEVLVQLKAKFPPPVAILPADDYAARRRILFGAEMQRLREIVRLAENPDTDDSRLRQEALESLEILYQIFDEFHGQAPQEVNDVELEEE